MYKAPHIIRRDIGPCWLIVFGFVIAMIASPLHNVRADFSVFSKIDESNTHSLVSINSSNSSKNVINYSEISLSEINPEIKGDLGNSKILFPSTGIVGDHAVIVPETYGSFQVEVVNGMFWLDHRNRFVTSDLQTGEAIRIEDLPIENLGIVDAKNTKTRYAKFQGSKSNPMFIVGFDKMSELGGIGGLVVVYDQNTGSVIVFSFDSPAATKQIGEKVWKTFLKSVTDKNKKSVRKSKQVTSKKESINTDYYTFINNGFLVNEKKFPKTIGGYSFAGVDTPFNLEELTESGEISHSYPGFLVTYEKDGLASESVSVLLVSMGPENVKDFKYKKENDVYRYPYKDIQFFCFPDDKSTERNCMWETEGGFNVAIVYYYARVDVNNSERVPQMIIKKGSRGALKVLDWFIEEFPVK